MDDAGIRCSGNGHVGDRYRLGAMAAEDELRKFLQLRNEQVILVQEAQRLVVDMKRLEERATKHLERADRLRGESESFEEAASSAGYYVDADDMVSESTSGSPPRLLKLESARAKLFKAAGIPYGEKLIRVEEQVNEFFGTYSNMIESARRIDQIASKLEELGEDASHMLDKAEEALGFDESNTAIRDYVVDHPHLDFVFNNAADAIGGEVELTSVDVDAGVQEILRYVAEEFDTEE